MLDRPCQAALAAVLLLAACNDGSTSYLDPSALFASDEPTPPAPSPSAASDPGTALVEARRCGRALAVAARCNYVRDDRDFAALRYTVLQGLDQRYGKVVDTPRLTEAVDLAVLDRMSTIGQCSIAPSQVPVVESGLRDVLGECATP